MKIVSKGNIIATPDFHKKRVRARRKKTLLVVGCLLLLSVLAIFLLRLKNLEIKEVEVTGTDTLVGSRVVDDVQGILDQYYLWILPKRDALIYPERQIEREVGSAFPRFSSVSVSLDGIDKLLVSVVERKPYALYCEEETCYFLDENGLVFDRAPIFSEGVYFIYRKWHDQISPLGTEFLPPAEFRSLAPLVKALPEARELSFINNEFVVTLNSGGTVEWSRERSAEKVGADLEAFLASDAIKKQGDFWQRLKTLDLRTENKVFYTFK